MISNQRSKPGINEDFSYLTSNKNVNENMALQDEPINELE